MNYQHLATEILICLRGARTQGQINQRLGYRFNKCSRWERGLASMPWPEFVQFCEVTKTDLRTPAKIAFSFHGSLKDSAKAVQHFVGQTKQTELARAIGVSHSTISRWISGKSVPALEQVLALMDFSSAEFIRFVDLLTRRRPLASIDDRRRDEQQQLNLFVKYPWLSILLSALDLEAYRKTPTEKFLSNKTRLPVSEIRLAIKDLHTLKLIEWSGSYWVTKLQRTTMVSLAKDDRMRIGRYVYSRTLDTLENSFGEPTSRFSWKMFSLNKSAYETILQRYTEFFNELGVIIDENQADADGIYIFSGGLIDFDDLPPAR